MRTLLLSDDVWCVGMHYESHLTFCRGSWFISVFYVQVFRDNAGFLLGSKILEWVYNGVGALILSLSYFLFVIDFK